MNPLIHWFYHLGFALFIGSIAVYCVISGMVANASLTDLVFARRVVRFGTVWITTPALWMFVLAGTLGVVRFAPSPPAVVAYASVVAALLAITHLFVVPATRDCLSCARQSLDANQLVPAYRRAYLKETVPGAINLLLGLWLLFTFP